MKEPWNNERLWRVSPANYHPDVLATYNFPEKIEILDTTLRDGEQQPGLFISPADRIRLAQRGERRYERCQEGHRRPFHG